MPEPDPADIPAAAPSDGPVDGPQQGTPAGSEPDGHADDGLDLARATARATAGTTPAARRRRTTPRATPGGAAGGARGGSGPRTAAEAAGRDPRLLAESVAGLVQAHGWELDLRIRSVFARWDELVGEEVAGHSTPESFDDGRLVVRAHSTAWATQLRLLAPSLVRRLCEDLGEATVTVVEVRGPHAPGWTRGRLSTRDSRGPRDTYG